MATPVPPVEIPEQRGDKLLAMLAEKVGASFTATNVFGPPTERDGVTVIPVARMRFGFGGGGGGDPKAGQEGEGGGAFGTGEAIGYIELRNGRSRFVPVVHPARMLMLAGALVLGAMVIQRRGEAVLAAGRLSRVLHR